MYIKRRVICQYGFNVYCDRKPVQALLSYGLFFINFVFIHYLCGLKVITNQSTVSHFVDKLCRRTL
jgi:hypothetical protein